MINFEALLISSLYYNKKPFNFAFRMDRFMALIGGVSPSAYTPEDTSLSSKPATHMVIPMSNKHKKLWVAIYVVMAILIITSIVFAVLNMVEQRKQIAQANIDMQSYITQLGIMASRTNQISTSLDQLGLRVSDLDHKAYTLVTPSLTKSGFQGKDRFISINYLAELELFKSLSPADQSDYLNMSKDAKRTKYPALQ
jgi:hypothetical protein